MVVEVIQVTTTIRLYRAMSDREIKHNITSSYVPKPDMIAHEIYSHVLSTYRLRIGPLYSLSDSLEQAVNMLQKHPDRYKAIGYIDLPVENGAFKLSENIIYLHRVSEIEDWLDIISNAGIFFFTNLNYNRPPVSILSVLTPSQKSVFSWSATAREYVVVAKNLKLHIIQDLDLYNDNAPIKSSSKVWIKNTCTVQTAAYIRDNIGALMLSPKRKSYIMRHVNPYLAITKPSYTNS